MRVPQVCEKGDLMTRRVNGKEEVGVYVVELDRVFMGPDHCARILKGDLSAVYKVLRGERKTHKGFTIQWAVADKEKNDSEKIKQHKKS